MSTIGPMRWIWGADGRRDSLVLNEGIAEIKRLWMATKQFHDTVTGSDVLRKRVKTVGVAMRNACEPYCFAPRNSEKASVLRTERARRQIHIATDELRYDLTVNGASETADTYSYWWVEIWPHSGRTSKEHELHYFECNSILNRKPA